MTVAEENARAISRASPLPIGETVPSSESETMIATPQMTAKMAIQVGSDTRSRNSRNAMSAASNGTPACISTTFATVV